MASTGGAGPTSVRSLRPVVRRYEIGWSLDPYSTSHRGPESPAQPSVAVIIAMRNAATTIDDQLEALVDQHYEGAWEVVVADNGSTDDSADRVRRWAERSPRVRLVDASQERGAHHARNVAIAASDSDLLLFCDADDVVRPGWIAAMVEALSRHDVVGGRVVIDRINAEPARTWSGPGPLSTTTETAALRRHRGGVDFAIGANCGTHRRVNEAIGGWRGDYAGCEDVDYSMRAQLAGFTIGAAPEAVIDYRVRADLRSLARNFFFYGRGAAGLARHEIEAQRTIAARAGRPGQPGPGAGEGSRLIWWVVRSTPAALVSSRTRGMWVRTVAHAAGFLTGRIRG